LCATLANKTECSSWCGCAPVPVHLNKRKEKEQAVEKEKKQMRVDVFASFKAASKIEAQPSDVAKNSGLSLGFVSSVLNLAEKDLKQKELEQRAAGGAGTERDGKVQPVEQVQVVRYMISSRATFTQTKKHFLKQDNALGLLLNEPSVRRWKKNYILLRDRYIRDDFNWNDAEAAAQEEYMTGVKKGRPTLMGKDHNNMIEILKGIRASDGKVNPMVVVSVGKAVMINSGRSAELFENGGHIALDIPWARGILDNTLGWSHRKATTDRKLTAAEAVECAQQAKVLEEKIEQYHPDLVIEMDETLAPWCPQDNTTYAEQGEGRIAMINQNDKRGHTLTVSITKRELLPFHSIWDGLTDRSIPKCHWPKDFVNSYAGKTGERITKDGKTVSKSNKWQNRKTMKEYLEGIVKPHLARTRSSPAFLASPRRAKGSRALLVMDHHWSHEEKSNDCITSFCAEQDLDVEFVPKKATDLFSVLDVAVNKPIKGHLKNSFMGHCTSEITKQLATGVKPADIKLDVRTSTIKPLAGDWVIACYHAMKEQEGAMIPAGWRQVSDNITRILAQ
jgi:hypothetical protein